VGVNDCPRKFYGNSRAWGMEKESWKSKKIGASQWGKETGNCLLWRLITSSRGEGRGGDWDSRVSQKPVDTVIGIERGGAVVRAGRKLGAKKKSRRRCSDKCGQKKASRGSRNVTRKLKRKRVAVRGGTGGSSLFRNV